MVLHGVIRFVSRSTIHPRSFNVFSTHQRIHQSPLALARLHTQTIHWKHDDSEVRKCKLLTFRLERPGRENPLQAITVNDATSCREAIQHIKDGNALVYSGNYNNARQLLQAIKKRYTKQVRALTFQKSKSVTRLWIETRKLQKKQSEVVNKLLVQVGLCENNRPCDILGLKKVPHNTKKILEFAFQNDDQIVSGVSSADKESACVLFSMNDFIGIIGSFEWNKKGVYISALEKYIYPHWGVFPPTRQDYTSLLSHVNFDSTQPIRMLEVGIGTGILSFILLEENKVHRVIGTDINPYAIKCTRHNAQMLGLDEKIDLVHADLFPEASSTTKYDVVLFNPPWLPGNHSTTLDQAVYDTSNQDILRRFLSGVHKHLQPGGHVYVILSNLGVLLGLFNKDDLNQMFEEAGMRVVEEYKLMTDEERNDINWPSDVSNDVTSIKSAKKNEVISLFHLRLVESNS